MSVVARLSAQIWRGHKLKLPSTVEFNIGFNPLKGAAATRFGETSANVGKVKYDISKNTFTFNGQPMNDKAMADMARKCRAAATIIKAVAIAYSWTRESAFSRLAELCATFARGGDSGEARAV